MTPLTRQMNVQIVTDVNGRCSGINTVAGSNGLQFVFPSDVLIFYSTQTFPQVFCLYPLTCCKLFLRHSFFHPFPTKMILKKFFKLYVL